MDMVKSVHWVHPRLLDLADFLDGYWESIIKLHPPLCEFLHGFSLYIYLFLASVLPKLTHNQVVEFQSLSIGKGVIRLCP